MGFFKILLIIILIFSLLTGFNVINHSNTEIIVKNTVDLPAGFSIESSIPINLTQLKKLEKMFINKIENKSINMEK